MYLKSLILFLRHTKRLKKWQVIQIIDLTILADSKCLYITRIIEKIIILIYTYI